MPVHQLLAEIIVAKRADHRWQPIGVRVRDMDVLIPHLAVVGLIDLQMLTQEIGSKYLNGLWVDNWPECIAQCEQKYLQALPVLALGDVLKHRNDRPTTGTSRSEQVDFKPAVEGGNEVLKARWLATKGDLSYSLDHGWVDLGHHVADALADHFAAHAAHGVKRTIDREKAVIGRTVVFIKQDFEGRYTFVDGFEQRMEWLVRCNGCVSVAGRGMVLGKGDGRAYKISLAVGQVLWSFGLKAFALISLSVPEVGLPFPHSAIINASITN